MGAHGWATFKDVQAMGQYSVGEMSGHSGNLCILQASTLLRKAAS